MPHYDDSFLDSPIFRRRAKSYSVLKQDVPKSKTFQITAIPLLLAVTNPTRSFALSTSSCNLQGMAEAEEWMRILKYVLNVQLIVMRWAERETQRIIREREAAAARENEASRESPSTSSQSLVLTFQQTVQASPSRPPVQPARQVVRSRVQQPSSIQASQGDDRLQRSNDLRYRGRRVVMRRTPFFRLYRRQGTWVYLSADE